jgi:repressor LexA
MLYELKSIRKKAGISQADAAKHFDVPLSTYRNWEQCKNIPRDNRTIKELADYFQVSMEALYGYDAFEQGDLLEATDDKFVYVPRYGRIAAGDPLFMDEVQDHVLVPKEMARRHPHCFLLTIEGESMNRVLPNGCYALVDPEENDPVDGRAYAVCVNGYDATVKRVHPLEHGIELDPDSTDPTFHPMVYDETVEGTETVTIIGEVVWYTVPFDFEI